MLTFPDQSQALQLKPSQEKSPTFLWDPTTITKFQNVKDLNILKSI